MKHAPSGHRIFALMLVYAQLHCPHFPGFFLCIHIPVLKIEKQWGQTMKIYIKKQAPDNRKRPLPVIP